MAGFDLRWEGEAEQARGIDRANNWVVVRVNPEFYRPAEVELLIGNPAKAVGQSGWKPTTRIDHLVEMMVKADLDRTSKGALHFYDAHCNRT